MQHYKTKLTIVKALTAAAVLMTAVAQAALTGDVVVNGWTTATSAKSLSVPGGLDFTIMDYHNATAVATDGDFSKFLPSLDMNPGSVNVSPITLTAVNTTTWNLQNSITIDFGTVTYGLGGPSGDLKFVVDPGNLLTMKNVMVGHAPSVNNYSFMELSDLSGTWVFNNTTTIGTAHLNLTRLTLNPKSTIPGEFQFAITSVPEPATYLAGLGTLGMLGLFGWRSRK